MNGGLASLVLTRVSCIPTGSGALSGRPVELSLKTRSQGVHEQAASGLTLMIRVSLVGSVVIPDSGHGALILPGDPFGPGRMPWRISAAATLRLLAGPGLRPRAPLAFASLAAARNKPPPGLSELARALPD
jgi:hypothetical protein